MKASNEIRRLKKAAMALPDPGCPACRARKGFIVTVEDGVFPTPCVACGVVAEFIIEIVPCQPRGDGGDGGGP